MLKNNKKIIQEKRKLKKLIANIKKDKQKVLLTLNKLVSELDKKQIHIIEYKNKLKKLLNKQSVNEYIKDYINKINKLERRLFLLNKKEELKKEFPNNIFKNYSIFLFLLFFSLAYFYLDPSITGHYIYEINIADTTLPNITINSPNNNSNLSYTNIIFNVTPEEVNLIQNVSILGNWTGTFQINKTNSSLGLANNYTIISINITQGRGFYLWAATTCDNSSNCNTSSNMTFFINRIPEITSINISSDHTANKSTGNTTGQFNYLDPDNITMVLNETRWYNNSIEIINFTNLTYIDYLNMTTGDNWVFSARVFDGDNWSIWYNSSGYSVQNNSAPSFSGTILDQTWSEDTSLLNIINLSLFFSDPENDALNYTAIGNKAINVSIVNGLVSFILVSDWFGTEYVIFRANDSNLTRDSNNITLTVTNLSEAPHVSQEGGGVSREYIGLSIVAPSPKTVFLKDKISIPLIIKNTGNKLLQGIKLSTSSSEKNIKHTLEKSTIANLVPDTEEVITLDIISYLKEEKNVIEIIVNAEVNNPQIKDSFKIYLNAIEFGASNKSVIIPRLQYAKDLFNNNKECQSLKELVDKAEVLLSLNKLNEAQSLIENVINGCNDIIVLTPKKLEVSKKETNEKLIFFIEIFVLILLFIGFMFYYKKIRRK